MCAEPTDPPGHRQLAEQTTEDEAAEQRAIIASRRAREAAKECGR